MIEEQYWVSVKTHQPGWVLVVAGPFATYAEAHREQELLQNGVFLRRGQEYVCVPVLAKTAKEAKAKAAEG